MTDTKKAAEREAFERWAHDYALVYEPNYSKQTEADCLAAFKAGAEWQARAALPAPAPIICEDCGDECTAHDPGVCGNCYAMKYRDAAPPAVQVPQWISVEERLPDAGQYVIVTRFAGPIQNKEHPGYPGKPWTEFSSVGGRGDIFLCDLLSTGNVTHWQPLPPPPAATQGDEK